MHINFTVDISYIPRNNEDETLGRCQHTADFVLLFSYGQNLIIPGVCRNI
jgi:hypothetical protein